MFLNQLFEALKLIGRSFIKEPEIWWFLAPVFILWIVMEVYFGQYKKERIGWNSLLANGISFAWINVASLRVLFSSPIRGNNFQVRLLISLLFLIYSFFVIYIAFRHSLSEKMGQWLAGPTTVYFLSTVSVLWGQGVLVISEWVLIDFIILYLIVYLLFWLIKRRLGVLGEVEAIEKGQSPL